ncbi:hypothetical protein, partial [Microvirgula aerodenitrificans]|uniref:hypothetical protein n=1 Tax=Microvirgula aerodenitrificans TaxID=57480 RepID=UPI00248F12CA
KTGYINHRALKLSATESGVTSGQHQSIPGICVTFRALPRKKKPLLSQWLLCLTRLTELTGKYA